MLSRLSGLANVVLHELSGDDTDQNMRASLDPVSTSDMEFNDRTQEDVLERLAYAEHLVVELKEVIRQKDIQLQQKDDVLQEERKAADNKIKKLKLHAKAKLTSLNKHLEEMKAQGGAALPAEPQSEEQLSKHDKSSTEEEMEVEKIKHKLQEKEELISSLQAQLTQAQAEQFDKSSKEMEEFLMMKQQLQEKEELISTLQAQLSQTQAEQAAQVVREKDARFETQVRLHEDELLQLVTQADVETEMQQKLRVLQRKLEEHEEALLGRAQVVDLLQQELTAAEQRNQILSQQLQQIEAEHNILRNTVETERQESKILMEKMELEVEEMHHVLEQLEQAGQAQAELQSRYSALEQKHKAEMEEKTSHILSLQKTEQELHSVCDSLKDENSKLLQDKSKQAIHSAEAIQQLEDQLQQKSKEISQFLNKPTLQKHETASQTSFPDVYNEGTQAVTEENIAFLQKRVVELENEKGALLLSSIELEELKAENEKLSCQITLLEAQSRTGGAHGEVSELKELKNLQQQYLQINQEITELRPLKAQLQEYQDKTKTFQIMQEELRQENLSWQHELHQLRMEKSSWEIHERRMKEQYLMAISDKDQQLSHLQNLLRELRSSSSQTETLQGQYQRQASPETSTSPEGSQNLVYETELLRTQLNDSLKEIHQKELRIQQLNSKFSQLLEEKNTLSVQLCDTSQSLRENQQHYSDLFNHCAVLEKQVQELQAGPLNIDVAPGAPQEKNGAHRKSDPEELREPQLSLSEAQLCNTKQEMNELRKLLEEERDQRVAAETALSVAEEQIRRLELGEWDSARSPIIGSCGTQEQALLIDLTSSSCRRTRSGAGWKRVLRSLCHSRTRVPLLAAIYFLMVHVLLILCFTGRL
uniref:Golgin subfamily B member 1 n=1 Tax=Equus asinus TaxID=9793 RepID=A0A8C4M633_EQUAS